MRAFTLAWLLSNGYQPHQADAMIRSAWVESRLQPCAVGRSGSYLWQWAGPRLAALHAFSGNKGCPTLEQQLAFANHELRTERSMAGFWTAPPAQSYRAFRVLFERCRTCGRRVSAQAAVSPR